jgi:hypothetical protein
VAQRENHKESETKKIVQAGDSRPWLFINYNKTHEQKEKPDTCTQDGQQPIFLLEDKGSLKSLVFSPKFVANLLTGPMFIQILAYFGGRLKRLIINGDQDIILPYACSSCGVFLHYSGDNEAIDSLIKSPMKMMLDLGIGIKPVGYVGDGGGHQHDSDYGVQYP